MKSTAPAIPENDLREQIRTTEKSLVELALDRYIARRFRRGMVDGRIRDLKTAEGLNAFLTNRGFELVEVA